MSVVTQTLSTTVIIVIVNERQPVSRDQAKQFFVLYLDCEGEIKM